MGLRTIRLQGFIQFFFYPIHGDVHNGGLIPYRGLVSKETVVLRRWGSDTRKFGLSTELIM